MPITVWQVGGDDIRFRIPMLSLLREGGFAVGAAGTDADAPFHAAGIPYHRFSMQRRPSPMGDLRTRRELAALFARHRPDIVHAFDTKPTYLAPSAALAAGVPGRVCTITGMGWLFSSNAPMALLFRPVYRMLQRRACRDSSATVFQNEEDRRAFLDNGIVVPGRDRLVRGSGIDLEALTRRFPDAGALDRLRRELGVAGRRVVVMISRLVAQKGIREYVAAAVAVRSRRDDVVFLLVGGATRGERGSVPIDEVRRAAGDSVQVLGQRDDVPALLALSDLFALPSYYREGVPRVLLEAGATGLPLIAADVPGSRDVVRDGWNGLLVPPRDAPALATAIEKLLDAPALRAQMGVRGRERVREEFSLERVTGEYAAIYRDVVPR